MRLLDELLDEMGWPALTLLITGLTFAAMTALAWAQAPAKAAPDVAALQRDLAQYRAYTTQLEADLQAKSRQLAVCTAGSETLKAELEAKAEAPKK